VRDKVTLLPQENSVVFELRVAAVDPITVL
jgi:hypothetical protein